MSEKIPDARLEINGVLYDLYLTKDEHGWGAIAFQLPNRIDIFVASEEDDHDFRANALGDLVAAIYQDVTPGTNNDDHEHDGPDSLLDEEGT